MAAEGQADGSIIVETELDSQGFAAGSKELQSAIKSLSAKVTALGPTLQKGVNGSAAALGTFDAKAALLGDTVTEIDEKMEQLGAARVPTEGYAQLQESAQKAEQALFRLYDKQEKMEALGTSKNSQSWKSLQYDITLAREEVERLERAMAGMEQNGTAMQAGTETDQYAAMSASLDQSKAKLAEMEAEAEKAAAAGADIGNKTSVGARAGQAAVSLLKSAGEGLRKSLSSAFSSIASLGKKAFTGLANLGKKAFMGIGKAMLSAIQRLSIFRKQTGGAESGIKSLAKKLSSLTSMLKRMVLRKIMQGVITAVKEGMNNLAQFSTQTNSDLSALKSGLTQLKNSFAAAFAPILTVVTPILTTLMSYISRAMEAVGKFIATLTGQKTFTRAVAVQEDYAGSLAQTGKEAEETKRQLAGFDELNVLSDSKGSDSGSGGGASPAPSEMFEEEEIEGGGFAEQLREMFLSGDYEGIGTELAERLNGIVDTVKNTISWENVGGRVTEFVTNFAAAFNSLIDGIDWENIGATLGEGLNTISNTLDLIITQIDWAGLSAGFAEGLNGFIAAVDWAGLGTTVADGVNTIFASLYAFASTFDWSGAATSLTTGINSAIEGTDWDGIGAAIVGFFGGVLTFLLTFLSTFDWTGFMTGLATGMNHIVTDIDWAGLGTLLTGFFNGVLAGLLAFLTTFDIAGFAGSMATMLSNTINGIDWAGLGTLLVAFATTLLGSIDSAVLAFDWGGIGTDIATLINSIDWPSLASNLAKTVGDIVLAALDALINLVQNIDWGKLAGDLWDCMVNMIKSIQWGNLITKVFELLGSAIAGLVRVIITLCKKIWDGLKDGFHKTINYFKEKIKDTGGNVLEGLLQGIIDGMKNIGKWIKDHIFSPFVDGFKKVFGIESPAKTMMEPGEMISAGIQKGADRGWGAMLRDVGGWSRDMVGTLTDGMSANERKAGAAAGGIASAISRELQAGDYTLALGGRDGLTGQLGTTLDRFAARVEDSFSRLVERLNAITERVVFAMPTAAMGYLPYGVGGSTVGVATDALSLVNLVVQAVGDASARIVDAVREGGDVHVTVDTDSLTREVINDINRRTRMHGVSPFVG